MENIRKTAVAGQFYAGDPARLRETVHSYIERLPQFPERKPLALIVPHAGYQYSGPTAGAAFAEIREHVKSYRRVVVMAPSHRTPFRGVSTGQYEAYETPLGNLTVDADACERLANASDRITQRTDAQEGEHALEVELPFLAELLPDAQLIPLICGEMGAEDLDEVADVLARELASPETLWIVSSDFTHYGQAFGYLPFQADVARRLEELDHGAIDAICQIDASAFLSYVEETGATICGRIPIALMLHVVKKAASHPECELLEYTNIGKMTGDYHHSVSYAALALYGSFKADGGDESENGEDANSATAGDDVGMEIPPDERIFLLGLARKTIETRLKGEKIEVDHQAIPANLRQKRACFVTLHKNGRLRGCIGSLQAVEPLYENVIHNARNAAFQDPRFPELSAEELDAIDIEISVLTPERRIRDIKEFVVGRHGIILEKGPNRSVFLPQVAPEQGWDRETTLQYLSLKAGLGENAWRHGAVLKVFEAIVFGDKQN
ncbi:MAG: AmmeMemoRadiSam system protein B [Verrucomicrobiota bacterium]